MEPCNNTPDEITRNAAKRARDVAYYSTNREAVLARKREYSAANRETLRNRSREHYYSNREAVLAKKREYHAANREAIITRQRDHRKTAHAVERRSAYLKARLREDVTFKISIYMRNRVRRCVKNKSSKPLEALVGCSFDELKMHLERQFAKGMDWKNWSVKGWHIDHIRPLSSFDLSDPDEVKAAWHFLNLRPLWGRENMAKSDSVSLLC